MGKMDNKSLDEKAALLHDNYSDSDYSFKSCPKEFDTVYGIMLRAFDKKYEDVFSDGFFKAIKSFDSNKGDFKGLLKTILDNDLKDQHNSDMRQRRKKVGETIDENGEKHNEYIYFEELDDALEGKEGDDEGTKHDIIKDQKEDVERVVQAKSQLERVYLNLADFTIDKKREYSKKRTFCYPPLFFTDMLTALQQSAAVTEFISKYQQKLDDAAEIPFANHYLVRECFGVCDIRDNQFKPLSEFTGKELDKDKDCGNPKAGSFLWLDYNVYTTYVLKTTGKAVSTSNISDQSKKFAGLMRDTLKKKGESLLE